MDTQLRPPVVSREIDFGLPENSRYIIVYLTTTPSIYCDDVIAFLKYIHLLVN